MFRDLVDHSLGCETSKRYTFDLHTIASLARERDQHIALTVGPNGIPKVLNLTAVIFHESRCGSTLAANVLIGMDPTRHRVYSESGPPASALLGVCGESYTLCQPHQAALIVRDVLYLMSRSNDPLEERVFFKFQSVTTRSLPVFTMAYPNTPWLFVFREPVQVMMSHIRDGLQYANCVRSRSNPPQRIRDILTRNHIRQVDAMTAEDYCAAHLASITESAVASFEDDKNGRGIPILYDTLIDTLVEDVLPHRLGVPVGDTERGRIQQITSMYAKGRGSRARHFSSDSEQKEKEASEACKQAAATFLQESFDTLSSYVERQKQIQS